MTYFFWITSIILVALQFVNHWFLGKGNLKVVYPVSIVVYIMYIIVETTLALNDPTQAGILLFNLVNTWALFNAVKGYLRERDKKE